MEYLSKWGVNSGSYQIFEYGVWILCMNIILISIEYQFVDVCLLVVDGYQYLLVNVFIFQVLFEVIVECWWYIYCCYLQYSINFVFGVYGQVDLIIGVL